jgi:hypothetical protein
VKATLSVFGKSPTMQMEYGRVGSLYETDWLAIETHT